MNYKLKLLINPDAGYVMMEINQGEILPFEPAYLISTLTSHFPHPEDIQQISIQDPEEGYYPDDEITFNIQFNNLSQEQIAQTIKKLSANLKQKSEIFQITP
ncbi:hypothetical protein [Candidatus Phytoplasma pruni]|uniref:Uncharacterized protein n=1 Tax=Candidatus Phytoplasma pruni TaxID=479893 RepID=A0A851HCP5_9MOLU|nr:hypothetical protein [Candidatus Phytoplasma pruni]NWN45758.1 hypothetical protein [Candidatus Phytoplasma pruni]